MLSSVLRRVLTRFSALAVAFAAPLLGADAALAQALQQAPTPPVFTEVVGQREFSGFLIARPLQPEEAQRRGVTEAQRMNLRRRALRDMADLGISREFPEVDEFIVRVPEGESESTVAARLLATGAYEYVHPDWIVFPIANCPNDPLLSQQWHHNANRLNSCAAWAIQTGSPTIVVAICDTGVRVTHQDLLLNRVEGYHVPTQKWESQGGPINDINGHGTLCTGAAAANGNNGVGVVGMGFNIGHRMMRVTDSSNGSASLSNLTLAARRAAEFGDKIASVSYSGVNSSSVFTTGTYVRSLGSMLVWAAGNSNVNLNGNREDNVIVVGATTQSDTKASFSNYGPLVDLVAPGVSIRTTSNSGNAAYAYVNGTSFSAPIVAGLCALIWSQDPSLTPGEVETIIRATCVDLGAAGVDNIFGYGRVDAGAALALVGDAGGGDDRDDPDTTPPAAPTGLAATAGDGRVDLAWNSSPESDLAGYALFRSVNGGDFVAVTGSLLTSTSYADTGLVNGSTYTYVLFAEDISGNVSDPSAPVSAVPVAPPAAVIAFSDGFESGNLTGGGWSVQNSNAFATTAASFTGNWGARVQQSTWMQRAVSTVGLTGIEVSYARRTQSLVGQQWLFVEWWNGSSWQQIEQVRSPNWQNVSFPLPAAAANNPSFTLRFRINSNNSSRFADIDNVQIRGTPTN